MKANVPNCSGRHIAPCLILSHVKYGGSVERVTLNAVTVSKINARLWPYRI
jgi:hypothetical protein